MGKWEKRNLSVLGKDKIINSGIRVLELEAKAITALSENLSSTFCEAVEILSKCNGKVIVTGMGKSGHIGQKIAATFSSTGTPAQFIHPGEASHGDLGNISKEDILIILSNSGETPELYNIVTYSKKSQIPIIGISSKQSSTLSENSNISLILPDLGEACPNGLAPTTSTTLMLSLGDALCVALMEKKKFSKSDFLEFHPGGNLGAKLKPISAIMHSGVELPLINIGNNMSEALIEMTKKGFGITGVISENGDLEGVISDGDLRRNMEGLLEKGVSEVMTRNPIVLNPSINVSDTLNLMNENKITSVFISETEDGNFPIGIVHLHDCLRLGNG